MQSTGGSKKSNKISLNADSISRAAEERIIYKLTQITKKGKGVGTAMRRITRPEYKVSDTRFNIVKYVNYAKKNKMVGKGDKAEPYSLLFNNRLYGPDTVVRQYAQSGRLPYQDIIANYQSVLAIIGLIDTFGIKTPEDVGSIDDDVMIEQLESASGIGWNNTGITIARSMIIEYLQLRQETRESKNQLTFCTTPENVHYLYRVVKLLLMRAASLSNTIASVVNHNVTEGKNYMVIDLTNAKLSEADDKPKKIIGYSVLHIPATGASSHIGNVLGSGLTKGSRYYPFVVRIASQQVQRAYNEGDTEGVEEYYSALLEGFANILDGIKDVLRVDILSAISMLEGPRSGAYGDYNITADDMVSDIINISEGSIQRILEADKRLQQGTTSNVQRTSPIRQRGRREQLYQLAYPSQQVMRPSAAPVTYQYTQQSGYPSTSTTTGMDLTRLPTGGSGTSTSTSSFSTARGSTTGTQPGTSTITREQAMNI